MFKNTVLDHCGKDKKCREKKNCLRFFPEIITGDISGFFYAYVYFERDYIGQSVL